MRPFFLLVISAAASMLVIPLAWRIAPWLGMVDQPDPRKVHKSPVPRVGGWGIVAGCLLPLLLFFDLSNPLPLSFMAGMLVLFAFGAWDDARQIGHWPKFLGQLIAVALVVFWGDLYVTRLPFFDGYVLDPVAGRMLTMVALIGVINAINHSDGLDGLAAGESLLSLIAMAFMGYLVGADLVLDLALIMIGGIVGFLRYNTHPARVFMGDAGSQVLGFALGFLVIYLMQEANTAASAALPLLLLGLPIADINVVLYRRIRGGMSWFKATRNHVHHRLLDLEFTHYQSVVLIYSFQACLVACAVLLRYASDLAVVLLYFGAIGALFALLMLAERRGWKRDMREQRSQRLLPVPASTRAVRGARLQSTFVWIIAATVSFLMLFAVFRSGEVPLDFGITAGVLLLVSLAAIAWHRDWQGFTLRVLAYGTAAVATYLLLNYPAGPGASQQGFGVVIVVLAAMLAIFVRFLSNGRFGTTPTDYLIGYALLVLLAVAAIGGRGFSAGSPLQLVTFLVVLFYGCEVVIGHLQRWRSVLGSASFAALLVVAVRGLATAF